MNSTTKIFFILLLIILLGGWLLFSLITPEKAKTIDRTTFQSWFWEKREMDLVVQVLLVFSGALGIAAILPGDEEPKG